MAVLETDCQERLWYKMSKKEAASFDCDFLFTRVRDKNALKKVESAA